MQTLTYMYFSITLNETVSYATYANQYTNQLSSQSWNIQANL